MRTTAPPRRSDDDRPERGNDTLATGVRARRPGREEFLDPRPRAVVRRQEGGNMERNRRALYFALYILGLVLLAVVVAVVVVLLLGGWR